MRPDRFYCMSGTKAFLLNEHKAVLEISNSPSREIDSGRSDSGTATETIKTATIAAADGRIDGEGIVGDTITLGTKVLHIAKDLIGGVGIEGGLALMSDVLHPVGIGKLEERGTHKEHKSQDAHDGRLVRDR